MRKSKIKSTNIKKQLYSFFNDMIKIKNFDLNNIKLDQKSYENIVIYCIGYVTIKDSKYVKIYTVNPLYLIFNKANGRCKYLTLVPINESKEKTLKYEELWIKISDLIRSITKNDFDKRYVKIKFNVYEELPLSKAIEFLP